MNQIGVIIPVYNGEKTIEKSISSLLQQTYTDWLAIIIDDGSTDNTKSILNKYSGRKQFHIVHFDKNRGRPYARQEGLEIIKNKKIKYMCMLDADDWYYPDKLEYQYNFMEKNNIVSLLSMSIGVTKIDNILFRILEPFSHYTVLNYCSYNHYKPVPHASSIIRVKDIGNYNFDLFMKFGQDQDFMRRFLLNKCYAFVPKIVYIYNREDSFSFNKYYNSMKFSRKSFKKLNLPILKTFKFYLNSYLKLIIVGVLCLFRLEKYYLSKIGREPSKNDIDTFRSLMK